jgi:hypothetical protein
MFSDQGVVGYDGAMKTLALMAFAVSWMFAADTVEVFGRAWSVPVASDWKVETADGVPVLRLVEHRSPLPGPRRPIQFALADMPEYARLILEADVRPLGASLLIAFAYRDAAHFDYAHFSVDTGAKQPVHNGIFHVYGGERVRISSDRGPAAFSATGRWHHVKLIHDAATGVVDVMVDGKAVPALHAVDLSLGCGKIGPGSFDETGEFRNVIIATTAGT